MSKALIWLDPFRTMFYFTFLRQRIHFIFQRKAIGQAHSALAPRVIARTFLVEENGRSADWRTRLSSFLQGRRERERILPIPS